MDLGTHWREIKFLYIFGSMVGMKWLASSVNAMSQSRNVTLHMPFCDKLQSVEEQSDC